MTLYDAFLYFNVSVIFVSARLSFCLLSLSPRANKIYINDQNEISVFSFLLGVIYIRTLRCYIYDLTHYRVIVLVPSFFSHSSR